jgi:hypothetical protein
VGQWRFFRSRLPSTTKDGAAALEIGGTFSQKLAAAM